MKKEKTNRLKPVLAALKKAGFTVEEVAEQGKKTVITVAPADQNALTARSGEGPDFGT